MRDADADVASGGTALVAAVVCATFVVAAIVLEVVGGLGANSPVPFWADGAMPLSWPRAARAGWWLAVAGAAGGYRWCLARFGLAPRRWVTAVTVAPFVGFAAGVAAGAEWATWH